MLWWWQPANNYLLDCYNAVELSYASPLGHLGQAIKGCPLCGLHMLAGFSKAGVECREWGSLSNFRKAMGKCLDYMHLLVSAVQQESALSVYALWLLARSGRMPWQLVLNSPSQAAVGFCNCPHLQTLAREWENTMTIYSHLLHPGSRGMLQPSSLWFQQGNWIVLRPLTPLLH